MKTCCVLVHIFIALFLCDYGMSSSSSLEESPAATTNTSTSDITMTTAESATVTSDPNGLNNTTHHNTSTSDFLTTISPNDVHNVPSEDNKTMIADHPKSVTSNRATFTTANPKISKDHSGHYTGSVVILILIIILIIILLGILYFLRKKGRSYSFDLTRTDCPAGDYDAPIRDLKQQVISYEQTDNDMPACVDHTQEDKTSLTANGCAGETPDQSAALENEEQKVPEEISSTSSTSLTPTMKEVEFNLDLDLICGESELDSPTTSNTCDATHNENNNNNSQAGCGAAEEIFTEVSLDEPKYHT